MQYRIITDQLIHATKNNWLLYINLKLRHKLELFFAVWVKKECIT